MFLHWTLTSNNWRKKFHKNRKRKREIFMEKYPLDVPLYLAGRENLLEKTKKMIREKDNPIVPSQ